MKKCFLSISLLVTVFSLFSQGVSINATGTAADASAMLDISSTNSGLLIPRMDSTTIVAISNPATSLLVYQTDKDSGFYFYDGANWVPFLVNSNGANAGWSLRGNSGTTVGTHFLGTTDAEDFAVYTNNTERLRVDQTGNVGIGITNPSSDGVVGRFIDILDTDDQGVIFSRNTSNNGFGNGMVLFRNTANSATNQNIAQIVGVTEGTSNNKGGHIQFRTKQDGVNNSSSQPTTRMIILHNGNVGIGATSPEDLLDVRGNVRIPRSNKLILGNSGGGTGESIQNSFGLDGNYGIAFFAGNNEKVRIDASSGRVGIGTTSPTSILDAIGTGTFGNNSDITIGSKTSTAQERGNISYNGTLATFRITGTGGSVKTSIGAGGVDDYLSVLPGGNVGIGTTTPSTELHLAKTSPILTIEASNTTSTSTAVSYVSIATQGASQYGFIGDGSSSNDRISLTANGASNDAVVASINGDVHLVTGSGAGSERVTVKGGGNVGIGTTTPGNKLDINGGISTTCGVNCTSDKRYKRNIETLPKALDNVLQLRGVSYRWDQSKFPNKNFNSGKQVGVIAQELEKIYPELVKKDNQGYKSVNYAQLTPVLIEAIKEQQQIIDKQNSEIHTLKTTVAQQSEVDALKAEIEALKGALQQTSAKD